MNKDKEQFTNITNHLISLTIRDEYDSSRSKGIETYKEFADELNDLGIVPKSGRWTESSIKQFYTRVRKRYEDCDLRDYIDLDFVGRSSWEYQSRTIEEEVREGRNTRKQVPDEYENGIFYSYDKCGRYYNELEMWSKTGRDNPESDYWKVMKKFEKILKL
jgi:hypothetical protein